MRLIFMGTPASAVPTLAECIERGHEILSVWTQPDRPSGRGNKVTVAPVKAFAAARGIDVQQPDKIRVPEAQALFESYKADAAIVVAFGRILPPAYLCSPLKGCINVHFSLLPRYRGAAPVNWAIVQGEKETGVTTMLMDEGLDTGPVLLQESTDVNEQETAPRLLERLAGMGARLLGETLERFDEITPRPQRNEDATMAPLLRREDGRIDWALDAFAIERRVRGFQPWPNAYSEQEGRRLIVWSAEAIERFDDDVAPGTVVNTATGGLIISCGGGTALRLLEVQPEGRRRMHARDFLNGTRVKPGERFQ